METAKQNIDGNRKHWENVDNWINDGEEWSKPFGDTDTLWNQLIFPKVQYYLKGIVLEIAPGRGRMTRKLLENDIDLSIIDLSTTCIDRCKERYGDQISNYYVGNGSDLKDIPSNSIDFVFSFDSFVHIHAEVIDGYLNEINRVLEVGGYGWIHHSSLPSGDVYADLLANFANLAARSAMDLDKFKYFAEKYGLNVISQELIRWEGPGNPEWLHDGLSLIKK